MQGAISLQQAVKREAVACLDSVVEEEAMRAATVPAFLAQAAAQEAAAFLVQGAIWVQQAVVGEAAACSDSAAEEAAACLEQAVAVQAATVPAFLGQAAAQEAAAFSVVPVYSGQALVEEESICLQRVPARGVSACLAVTLPAALCLPAGELLAFSETTALWAVCLVRAAALGPASLGEAAQDFLAALGGTRCLAEGMQRMMLLTDRGRSGRDSLMPGHLSKR